MRGLFKATLSKLTVGALMAMGALGETSLYGDEGMWLYTNPPIERIKAKYGFEPTRDWMDHVQRSSVRFNSGGSGSFVSADGLVMTNHHVASDALQKMGTKEKNYYRDGFYAKTGRDEVKCEATELNVLMSIEDVTAQVNGVVKEGMPAGQAAMARRGIINKLEDDSFKNSGLRSNVITLYQGGVYHLYRFKKYTDVRLVFAPEQQIAFYGGDPDNFEYPRYDLDVAFFRVYEDGKPAKVKHFLKWSKDGCKENELTFVSGHPGRTTRLVTMEELAYSRDIGFPFLLKRLYRAEVLLTAFSARSEENARQAKETLFSIQNSRKARLGGQAGLMDPELIARKKAEEQRLRDAAAKKPEFADALIAYENIARAQKVRAELIKPYSMLEGGAAFNSELFGIARTLVRSAAEKAKPSAEKLREFIDSNKESMELSLFSEEPIHNDFEILKLADSLTFFAEELGIENPLVQAALGGKSPQARALELVLGTNIGKVAERKKLYAGGSEAIDASKDPLILLVKAIDVEARALRKRMETEVQEVTSQANLKISKVRFSLDGTNTYPDATFTLRLSYGTVIGYEENGKKVPAFTTFAGLYERSLEQKNKPPFDLPELWQKRKDKINLKTPYNFVSTADIIGGNSGSPVINKDAEVVGLIFDGNIQSLVLDFAYSDKEARAVSVCSQAITEALNKVYDAQKLAQELATGKAGN